MNRRATIEMPEAQRMAYVRDAKTIILCSHGRHGYPHAVAMWYVADDDGSIWMTTYRKSQKVLNLRRNPKVALHVESGVTYDTLQGVLIRGDAEIVDDTAVVFRTLQRVHEKMMGSFPDGIDDALLRQARKRVALHVVPRQIASWDHSRLGGTY